MNRIRFAYGTTDQTQERWSTLAQLTCPLSSCCPLDSSSTQNRPLRPSIDLNYILPQTTIASCSHRSLRSGPSHHVVPLAHECRLRRPSVLLTRRPHERTESNFMTRFPSFARAAKPICEYRNLSITTFPSFGRPDVVPDTSNARTVWSYLTNPHSRCLVYLPTHIDSYDPVYPKLDQHFNCRNRCRSVAITLFSGRFE